LEHADMILQSSSQAHIGGLDSPPSARDEASGACCLGMIAFVLVIFALGIVFGWACL